MAKKKGLDGKACWKGYKLMGTKKKGGRTVDNCVKMSHGGELHGGQTKLDKNKKHMEKTKQLQTYSAAK